MNCPMQPWSSYHIAGVVAYTFVAVIDVVGVVDVLGVDSKFVEGL